MNPKINPRWRTPVPAGDALIKLLRALADAQREMIAKLREDVQARDSEIARLRERIAALEER